MEKNQRRLALKQMVEQLARGLEKSGVEVTSGAIIDTKNGTIEGFGEKPPKEVLEKIMSTFAQKNEKREDKRLPNEEEISKLAKFIVNKVTQMAGISSSNTEEDKEDGEQCLCPNCDRYENFENIYKDVPGKFDFKNIELAGKPFAIKYFISNDGETEDMIVRDLTKGNREELKALTLEELQKALNIAIQNKDFRQAQEFLDAIQQIKTK